MAICQIFTCKAPRVPLRIRIAMKNDANNQLIATSLTDRSRMPKIVQLRSWMKRLWVSLSLPMISLDSLLCSNIDMLTSLSGRSP